LNGFEASFLLFLRFYFQKKKRRSLLFDLKNDLKNDLVKKNDLQSIGIASVQKP